MVLQLEKIKVESMLHLTTDLKKYKKKNLFTHIPQVKVILLLHQLKKLILFISSTVLEIKLVKHLQVFKMFHQKSKMAHIMLEQILTANLNTKFIHLMAEFQKKVMLQLKMNTTVIMRSN